MPISPPPAFLLRPAAAADAPAIRTLVRVGAINPTGLDWRRFVVAVAAGQVIGCGQVKPHRGKTRELASIAVAPVWRGRGVARAVITRLLLAYPGDLYLMCRASLERFYNKFGFLTIPQAEMPPYFRRINRLFRTAHAVLALGEGLLVMKR